VDRNRPSAGSAAPLHAGREAQFISQGEFEFAADTLGIDSKRLKVAEETAAAFPATLRDAKLSIDHYAVVKSLPRDEALPLLRQARSQHWTPGETRIEAVKRQAEIGLSNFLPRDDPEHDMLMAITRAWNRANVSVREQFVELAAESHLGVIDA
jgi:hypothetical protein